MVRGVYLEKREPEDNIHRFYEIDVDKDLFGVWCVARRWGRIGTRGRRLVESFDQVREAESEAGRALRAKSKRGYRAVETVS